MINYCYSNQVPDLDISIIAALTYFNDNCIHFILRFISFRHFCKVVTIESQVKKNKYKYMNILHRYPFAISSGLCSNIKKKIDLTKMAINSF